MKFTIVIISHVVFLTLFMIPRFSHACAPPGCMPAIFWPHWEEGQEIPVIPENRARLWIRYWGLSADTLQLQGTLVRDGQEHLVDITNESGVIVLPDAQQGDVWTVEDTHTCGGFTVSSRVQVRIDEAKPLPSSLGVLRVSDVRREEVHVADTSGPCGSPLDAAVVDIAIDYENEVLPYRNLLMYETIVDGQSWSAPSSVALPYEEGEVVRIFVACEEPTEYQMVPQLSEGTHIIRRIAWLPGESNGIESNEISVSITCDAVEPEKKKSSKGCKVASGTEFFFWPFWFFVAALLRRLRRK